MKTILKHLLLLAYGFMFGVAFIGSQGLADTQKAYTEGRDSVLNDVVYIGGKRDGQCDIALPLSALADMVNIGVLDWHKLCEVTE